MLDLVYHESEIIPTLDKITNEYGFHIEIEWNEEISIYELANDVIPGTADAVVLITTVYDENDSNFLTCIKKMLNRFNKWLEDNYQYVRIFRDNYDIESFNELKQVALGWYNK